MTHTRVNPVVDSTVRDLCVRRYPGHPRGCPNFGKKPTCPPQAPMIADVIDLERPVFAIWNRFDLAGHVRRMKERHPDWSKRQAVCCLYWQPRARKELRQRVVAFLRAHRGTRVVFTPEAMGVNVTATMRQAGVQLEWPPRSIAYQVALVGYRLKGETHEQS